MKSSYDEYGSGGPEPIAVVGIGCRFPGGARDLDSLGELLCAGTDLVREVPADRWAGKFHDPDRVRPGTTRSHVGVFLDGIDRFDAGYFGISPREAAGLDPQQRILLEVAWEAMSDSGRPRDAWRGSRTAVFMGMLAGDYATLHAKTVGITGIGPHYASGIEFSFAAGRIAHVFDLCGPSGTLNSACSSSLLAVHLAAQSLRSGECDAALAGGVNLLITPELSVFMSGIGAVSPSGCCRPFDVAADGVVRGEGCGVVVLRRWADAVADGDRVYAVILGSAVNHNGSSLGLTTPNPAAQAAVARAALAHAGLTPGDIDYVEAHGTGTPLGDQIELTTLAEVYGAAHTPDRPLFIGSHKAVLGHTDAAAGLAGLLRAIWVTCTRYAPPQHRLTEVLPVVDWEHTGVAVPAAGRPIPELDRPVRAGVSAFGLSGSNAHVIVAGVASSDEGHEQPGPYLLLLSAPQPGGVAEQAGRMHRIAAACDGEPAIAELIASAATRRTHEMHRCAIAAEDPAGILGALASFDDHPAGVFTGAADPDRVIEPVFVYSGQGCQWAGMAVDLYDADPAIRESLDECDALIREHVSWSLIDELRRADGSRLGGTDIAQPAIFAVQRAITGWLTARGVRPAAVLGHSVGEVTAAHVAGCLTAADAVRLVVLRGQVLQETVGTGRMTAVEADAGTVGDVLDHAGLPVVIAAENGPASLVLAGPSRDLLTVTDVLRDRGLRCTPLPVNYAFHSPLVAQCGPRLRLLLADLEPAAPAIRLLSSVIPGTDLTWPDAAYWEKNLTDPVLLWPAVSRLLAEMTPALIEISPHPVLTRPLTDATRTQGGGVAVSSLRRGEPGPLALRKILGRLYVAGVSADWEQVTGRPRQYRTLPLPSWGGDRYWLPGVRRGQQDKEHPAGQPGEGLPVRARVSLLDASGRVISEMITEPAGQELPDAPPVPQAGGDAPMSDRVNISDRVGTVVRQVLGLGPDQPLPWRRGLSELGLDSVMALELRARLETEFAVMLPPTVAFEYPTVADLSAHLAGLAPVPGPQIPGVTGDADLAIAVIGLACRLPGASSPGEYWSLLTEGRDAVGPLPADRQDDPVWAEIGPGVPTRGGYLDDVTRFDAAFFRVAPREARSLDPQQRIFLEVAWEALEDAGLPARETRGRDVGVYLGLNTADYQQLLTRRMSDVDLYYGTGTSFAAAAGRLSYFLGLRGPSMAIDTACSGSLTAVHLACQGLRGGDCELAIVGGSNVITTPTVSASMSAGGALSPDGRCKSFDDAADGYGRGEGAVAVVLKTLAAARRDRDRVYAVIRASAVNQDGASGGLTVPSPAAQASVIRRGLSRCGWAPHEVDYVEAHGTGTPLGDPLEVQALTQALGPGRMPQTPLLIGSVKANIGHLEAAAGVAGLLKVVLALHHGEIPPHRVSSPSSRIAWDQLPVALVLARQPWPDHGRPARAGISAFGFSGSNAHVLLEQAVARPEPAVPDQALPHVLVLTAATGSALRVVAGRMAARLAAASPGELARIVYTAAHRRTWLDHRLAVTGADAAELIEVLAAVAAGQSHPRARLGVATDETEDLFAAECAAAVAYGKRAGLQPVSLPAYPWERERYWYRDELTSARPAGDAQDGRWFRIGWEPVKPPEEADGDPAEWAVAGNCALAAELAVALKKRGHTVACIDSAQAGDAADHDRLAAWQHTLAAVVTEHPGCRGVVVVANPEPALALADLAARSASLLDVIALGRTMATLPQAPGRLWLVTSGAHDPARSGDVSLPHAALWEAGRALAVEVPGRWGGLIDADGDAESVARALCATNPDDQWCLRGATWYAARLLRAQPPEPRRESVATDRWHVALGGPSAGPAAGALLACGARRIVLVGDVPEPSAAAQGDLTWQRCGVDEMDDTLAALGPIGDVVAVAASGRTAGLTDVTESDVRGRLDENVRLARLCALASRHRPQRLTVVTSAGPSWGSVNTTAAAGAAGWLAGWARRQEPPVSLLGLMPRADTGELAEAHLVLFEQSGLRLLSAADTEDILRAALLGDPAERSAAAVDLRRYVRLCQDLAPRTFLSELLDTDRPSEAALRGRLLSLPPPAIAEMLLGHVCDVVARALGMQPAELDPDRGFFDLGLDSVMALSVRTQLEDDLGIELPSTLTFEYSSALQLASHLRDLLPLPATGTTAEPDDDRLLAELAAEMEAAERTLTAARDEPGRADRSDHAGA